MSTLLQKERILQINQRSHSDDKQELVGLFCPPGVNESVKYLTDRRVKKEATQVDVWIHIVSPAQLSKTESHWF